MSSPTYFHTPLDYIYNSLRSLLFTQIYPAPKIVNRGTRIFIGLQQLTLAIVKHYPFYCPVRFDFAGNLYNEIAAKAIKEETFEAAFITDQQVLYDPNKKYLIYLGGNTTCYQALMQEMLETHKRYNNKIILIGFNPPGVGLSPGRTEDLEHYCAALDAILINLNNNGVHCSNIMIIGHSLGAGIATRVVSQYQHQGKNIHLFADRTMLSIGDAVGTTIRNALPTWLLRNTLGTILYILAKILVRLLRLELKVAEDFMKINDITPGAAHGMMTHDDEMLIDCCLSHGLPPELPYFRQFMLRENDLHRRAHSKSRHELVAVNCEEETAEDYLNSVIDNFVYSKPALKT